MYTQEDRQIAHRLKSRADNLATRWRAFFSRLSKIGGAYDDPVSRITVSFDRVVNEPVYTIVLKTGLAPNFIESEPVRVSASEFSAFIDAEEQRLDTLEKRVSSRTVRMAD